MNQDLLIRLFRTIEGEPNEDIIKVASKIIEDESKRGHTKLATKLQEILDKNVQAYRSFQGKLKDILPRGINIPKDKRNNISLATPINREDLRHDMVLSKEIETKIHRIEREYVARERLKSHGLKPKQKILLHGAPGCGKSMAAERIAWNIGLPFLKVKFEAVISSFLGESANNLQRLFDSIKDYPCVLLLDEFDFIAKGRSTGHDVGEMHRLVNTLLNILEDYEAPGILVATTNFEGIIDFAMFRRFDEIIEMPKPSVREIAALLEQSLSSISMEKIDLYRAAESMAGFSSALVVKVAKDAAKASVIDGHKKLQSSYVEASIEENKLFNK